ncbi:pantoate--beta-alanine ligase [Corynebacterium sp. ES2794-CONJ1]|uniref:pantoate--beta-alanine ligase n=1 Tax=unclassified Corynebacterium TaxID=2624378 RepID=UPI002167BF15|nr:MULTISPECIES: pantoate--beta-alanine ligase [unclassified Corynebacterium]MCS4490248.1 pantoate--beta-alanine ligase [Corynebacterium sp. ES2775-CONJ]MCS4491941.1 pantoate--beta-alanine ligase [Corynebacterium sp. ES2715-CONJ3]MCS4532046.1 pantoate--beta-alanine ligase [Corynebacterium sp. ES2730-CONJ]MCU9519447.1 pantoate--beta-alanine ligase [Corynebacterium sp. ES2794-CONJ1]
MTPQRFQPRTAHEIVLSQAAAFSKVFKTQGKPVVAVFLRSPLHAGHIALMRAARRIPGAVVVVVSLHPIDRAVVEAEHIDLYIPYSKEQLWSRPPTLGLNIPDHKMQSPQLLATDLLEILALLGAVAPTDLIVGEKNYELLAHLAEAIRVFHSPVKIHRIPTVRNAQGLAISGRNDALLARERDQALALSAAVTAGLHAAEMGSAQVLAVVSDVLQAAGVDVIYKKLTALDLSPAVEKKPARLFIAARFAHTHLIDGAEIPLGIGIKNLD